jgi:hypothetical protein
MSTPEAARSAAPKGALLPAHRARWIVGGLALQVIGLALPVGLVLTRARREGVVGEISKYTIRLAWHDTLRSPSSLALVIGGILVYIAGSMTLARPFIRRRVLLWGAVPLAALGGLIVLGVAAIVVAGLVALAEGHLDFSGVDVSGFGPGWRSSDGSPNRRDEARNKRL